MRVAHLFISLPIGGAEDLVALLLKTAPPGVDLRLVCLRELGPLGRELQERGIPVELLPVATGKRVGPLSLWRLARWLQRERIGLVHSHVYNSHVWAALACQLVRIPFMFHHHKTASSMRLRRRLFMRVFSAKAAAHLCLSEQTAADLTHDFSIKSEKVHVYLNPIDRSEFHPAEKPGESRRKLGLQPGGLYVGTAASLTPPKNHALTLDMLEKLRTKGCNARFLLLGEGRLRNELETQARARKLDNLTLLGAKRPVAPWMQVLDVFTLASTWEGQPMALIQAMACGLPIAATRIEGNMDVLGSDHPALFEPDDPEAYADNVMKLLADRDFRSAVLCHQERRLDSWPDPRDYWSRLMNLYNHHSV